jgi:hypothetical protein
VVTYVDTKITLARKIDRERNNVPTNNLSALWFSNRNYYFFSISLFYQRVRSAYQPPASSTFLSGQTSHQQSASSTFLSEQISTSHQPNEQAD